MSTYTYREVLNQVQQLTDDEKLQLLEDVIASMRLRRATEEPQKEQHLHNVMEFRGFAKELWKGVDVEKYIDEERNSWDG